MVSSEISLAEEESSNLWGDLTHHGPGYSTGAEVNQSPARFSQMASTNKMASFVSPAGGDDHHQTSATQETSINKSAQNQQNLLRVPDTGNGRVVETSIWDWDTPLESVGDTSYYFEPQGELLQEQRERLSTRTEFNIPQAVTGSGIVWSSSPTTDLNNRDGFAIPRRPTGNLGSTAGVKRKSEIDQSPSTSRPADKRMSRVVSESGEDLPSPPDVRAMAHNTRSQSVSTARGPGVTATAEDRPRASSNFETGRPPSSVTGGSGARRTMTDSNNPTALPARKVFPIQIGDKLFRLSGASISSDAPSYFSQFFEEQLRQNEGADNIRTLYIDRDPATFEDIALHLQGYHIEPRDGPHFVKLFADAQFFSLPRLTSQLFSSTINIRIGDQEFQISRDLFNSPGDSPNYFTLGFSIFFTTPSDVFPGLSERSLLRPPSILPPSVPNRSAKTFADLLHVLKGYPLEIRSEEHRQELIRDAKYFHFKGLEQRLIKHKISYNLVRKQTEILIRLEDLRQSGLSYVSDNATGASSAAPSPASSTTSSNAAGPGWIHYQRPYVDPESYSLIVEIGGEESTFLSLLPSLSTATARLGRATFYRQTLSRITSLLSVIASKMNLPVTQPLGLMMLERGAGVVSLPVSPSNTGMSEERVKIRIGRDADVTVDGRRWTIPSDADDDAESVVAGAESTRSSRTGKRRRKESPEDEEEEGEEWVVRKAQWRLRVQPTTAAGGSGEVHSGRSGIEVILGAVKIEAFSNERSRNAGRGFLS